MFGFPSPPNPPTLERTHMAENKYYWLKLQEDFFDSKRIKKLRRIAGGDTYTIIYLKMQLKALKTGGVLEYTGIEKTFAEELALDLDEEPEDVGLCLNYLLSVGLIETSDNIDFFLPYVIENTGKEGSSAKRMREYRERQSQKLLENNISSHLVTTASQCDGEASLRYGEKEIEKEIEKEDILSGKPDYARIIGYLNEKTEKSFRANTKAYQSCINARYKEGFREADFFKVVDIMVTKWGNDPKMSEYLRPQTLFGTKMESYLQSQPYKDPHKVDREYGENGVQKGAIEW